MEESSRKEETREALYRRELATILRSSALINSSLNIEQVLDNAMKWAEDFMGAEASTVYELDDRSNELVVRLARGEKKGPPWGGSLSRWGRALPEPWSRQESPWLSRM